MVKPETLTSNHLFARAYRSKINFVSPFVVTYIVRRKTGELRYGITASKKLGCAVERNRARRVVKAAALPLMQAVDGPYDIVFVCRRALLSKKSTFINGLLRDHFKKAGILR